MNKFNLNKSGRLSCCMQERSREHFRVIANAQLSLSPLKAPRLHKPDGSAYAVTAICRKCSAQIPLVEPPAEEMPPAQRPFTCLKCTGHFFEIKLNEAKKEGVLRCVTCGKKFKFDLK